MCGETVEAIDEALGTYSKEPTVLVLHSTTPGMFVSGADIAELRDRTADDALRSINAGLFDRLAAHRWPVSYTHLTLPTILLV